MKKTEDETQSGHQLVQKLNLRGGLKSLKPSGRAGRYRATTNQWSQRSPRQSLVCILTSTGSVAVDAAVWQRSLVELVEYAQVRATLVTVA